MARLTLVRRADDRRLADDEAWWRDATFYQVYVRSFADADGDGVGDLEGIRSRLGYLELLGVDALWLTPFFSSPMVDHGYDVSDPRAVSPLFGDLNAFDRLIDDAHRRGLRVTIDVVPNHTSDRHVWFQAAVAAAPGSPERARYVFRDGSGFGGSRPPNNWTSTFGGPAWTRLSPSINDAGQWYLHLFAPEQPDLNWDNPEVAADLERTLRFWLDRGVDGFRIDVTHGMAKPAGLPDMPQPIEVGSGLLDADVADPRFDADGVHDIHRMIRKVIDEYPARMAIGEIWVIDDSAFARYIRPDELHLGFNFRLLEADFDAGSVRAAIEHSLMAVQGSPAPATWTISNHDSVRPVTRYGGGEVGLARAPGTGAGATRPAWTRVPVQRRRAGSAECRTAQVGVAGSGVEALRAHRARPRRLPGTAALAGQRAAVRIQRKPRHLAADARWLGSLHRGRQLRGFRLRRYRYTGRPWNCAKVTTRSAAPSWSGTAHRPDAWPSAVKAAG